MESCLIQSEIADKAADAVVRFLNENGMRAYDEKTRRGLVRHVYVRRAVNTADAVAVIVASGGFGARTQALVEHMRRACPELSGIVLNVNKSDGNTLLAGDFHTLWGREFIRDSLGGIVYELAPQAFYQINPPQAEKLYRKAVEYAAPEGKTVLDMYCGAGTISLFLAKAAKQVIGAEIIPEAVENARENARRNGIENADFICADASEAAEKFLRDGVRPEVIVVDPPRKGMDEAAVRALCGMAPDRAVYVSCNPATLARDITVFNSCGYELKCAEAVDMFPRTSHVETVVLLSKGEIDSKKVRVEFSLENMDMSGFQKGATYPQIKEYVREHSGLKVSSLYISQVKRKCGLDVGQNYNLSKKENVKQPQCPPEKELAIREAFNYFGML